MLSVTFSPKPACLHFSEVISSKFETTVDNFLEAVAPTKGIENDSKTTANSDVLAFSISWNSLSASFSPSCALYLWFFYSFRA